MVNNLLLNLLEMHTAYKQAICVSVLQIWKLATINKHALNYCKGSANEWNIKINTKFCFVFPSAAYLIKR